MNHDDRIGPGGENPWDDETPWEDGTTERPWGEDEGEAPRRGNRGTLVALSVAALALLVAGGGLVWWSVGHDSDPEQTADVASADATRTPVTTTRRSGPAAARPTTTGAAVPAPGGTATGGACTAEAIIRDTFVKKPYLIRCYGDWLTTSDEAGSGDTIVMRLVGGKWTSVGSPSGPCPDAALRAAMPVALYQNTYRMCAQRETTTTESSTTRGRPAPGAPAPRPAEAPAAPSPSSPAYTPPAYTPPAYTPPSVTETSETTTSEAATSEASAQGLATTG